MKLNYFKINNLVRTHKQIEIKNGYIYMRAKKRPIIFISKAG